MDNSPEQRSPEKVIERFETIIRKVRADELLDKYDIQTLRIFGIGMMERKIRKVREAKEEHDRKIEKLNSRKSI